MRFMMLMIPRVYQGGNGKRVAPDFTPGEKEVAQMTKYNEELSKAGMLISLDGLHPPEAGDRISFRGGEPVNADGPFTEVKNVLGGYWIIDAESKEEALAWARRCPAQDGDVIEVRQVFEMSEFPPEVRKAAEFATVPARPAKQKRR
jgi:hypothetical protein